MGIATLAAGYGLIVGSSGLWILTFVWFGARLIVDEEENQVLNWIQKDKYYCYLIPLMIPTSFIIVYANWLAMKFFRHN